MFEPSRMDPEHPLGPVRWLLGPDLVANLQKIALYAFSSGKLDVRDWMHGSVHAEHADRQGTFWFDYIADTGDSQLAMLCVARMCLSDVTIDRIPEELAGDAPPLDLPLTLPRGELLFVGGDTAYHVADKRTLDKRFCAPFRLAAETLGIDAEDRRPLFGIPGNHDYYDQLDGFNRQFRLPHQGHEGTPPDGELPLDVPGFRRVQDASYVAVQLPHGFWLLGMDTEQNKLDARQSAFFRRVLEERCQKPLKLIVCTPSPPIVHGKRPRKGDPAILPLLDIEELRPPFVPHRRARADTEVARGDTEVVRGDTDVARADEAEHTPAEIEQRSQDLAKGECRLYLAGDTHHYTRYFGARDGGQAACCASVVSGLGGAFLHPSHFDFGEVWRRRVYPSPEASRRAIGAALFRPFVVLNGGYVAIFGAVLAVALNCASVMLRARWLAFDALLLQAPTLRPFGRPGEDLHAITSAAAKVAAVLVVTVLLGLAVFAMQAGQRWAERRAARRSSPAKEPPAPRKRAAFNGRIAVGWALLAATAGLVLGGALIERALWVAFPALLVAATLLLGGIWQSNRMVRAGASRLVSGAVTLLCVAVGGALTAACFYVAEPASAQLMVFDFGFGFFLLFSLVMTAVALPLAGAVLHRELRRKLLYMGFGLYNFVLVVLVPFILVRTFHRDWHVMVSLAVVVAATAVLAEFGRRVYSSPRWRRWLVVLWLLLGLVWILVPVLGYAHELNRSETWGAELVFLAVSAVVGALVTSASFGWYFAVVDTWEGHDNEVGGAALVEEHKQMIRFRVTPEGLTAFVLAIDKPEVQPSCEAARPRLVDVFELRPKA